VYLYINVDGRRIVSISRVVRIKVVDPHHSNADPDTPCNNNANITFEGLKSYFCLIMR
jgi:hypothetical protein